MKKRLQRLSISAGKEGDAVILTIMVLLILFIFTASMLFLFGSWQKKAFKMISGRDAYRYARAGVEEAIWEIDNDDTGVDSFSDAWRVNFEGGDTDLNGDGVPDARWFCVRGKEGKVAGRYAVLVEDESGKVNVNSAGRSVDDLTYTVSDIDILSGVIGRAAASSIAEYGDKRECAVPSDVKMVEGIGGGTYAKMENYITCFSYDLNINRLGEERVNLNDASFETLYGLFKKLEYGDSTAAQIALNILAYRKSGLPVPVRTVGGEDFTGIDKTPYINEIDAVKPWKKDTLGSGTIILSEQGGQFIELFNPYEREIDISGWKIKGVVTLFSDSWREVLSGSGDMLEGFSRGEEDMPAENAEAILEKVVPVSITIPEGEKIPPLSYYTIGDRIAIKIVIIPGKPPVIFPLFVPIKDPPGCNHYEPILAVNPGSLGFISELLAHIPFLSGLGLDFKISLHDGEGGLVEKTTYFADLPFRTVQKNDPRMNGLLDWYLGKQTAGKHNSRFYPWIGGEFSKRDGLLNWPSSFDVRKESFRSIGELSSIHKKRQWETLDFWKYGRDRKIIDFFTVEDIPGKPVYGRLNINTSSETVLACLPHVGKNLAKALAGARPYKDISEVLGTRGRGKTSGELLSREMTLYGFDSRDNDGDGYIDTEKEKEFIFSRIINLITVRSNVFKIIALGQKVRNVENNGKIGEEILAEKKAVVWYDRRKKKVIYKREIQ